jgi:hypothetical protein
MWRSGAARFGASSLRGRTLSPMPHVPFLIFVCKKESSAEQQRANDQRDSELRHDAHSGPPFFGSKTMWQREGWFQNENIGSTPQDLASNSSMEKRARNGKRRDGCVSVRKSIAFHFDSLVTFLLAAWLSLSFKKIFAGFRADKQLTTRLKNTCCTKYIYWTY